MPLHRLSQYRQGYLCRNTQNGGERLTIAPVYNRIARLPRGKSCAKCAKRRKYKKSFCRGKVREVHAMLKSLQIDPEKCTGCLQCELACSYENEGVFNPSKSRIKVFNFHEQGRMVPYTCTQCDDAWCMSACISLAVRTAL